MTEAEKEMAEKIIMSMSFGSVVAFCNLHRYGWSEEELIEKMEMPPDQVRYFMESAEKHIDSQIRSTEFLDQYLDPQDDRGETRLRELLIEYVKTDYWSDETDRKYPEHEERLEPL